MNNGRLDLVAANTLGRSLFSPVYATPRPVGSPANHARFTFLDDRARDFWIDWERAADDSVSRLRTEAGRDPYYRALTDLVGEASTQSPRSAPAGPRTMSACTAPDASTSATPSSASSTSISRSSTCPPTPA